MKTAVTPKELRELLSREFEKSQPRRCWFTCRIPMPFQVDGDAGPTWALPEMHKCARGCDSLLAHIARRLQRDYDLASPRSHIITA
jgi:hypothetical protein